MLVLEIMATFQVPQFIEQKAKIVGPLTLKQFFFLGGAAGISVASFYIFNFVVWFFITFILAVIAISLAFVKVNGQELPAVLFSALSYLWQPRTYTWQRTLPQKSIDLSGLEKIEKLRKTMGLQEKLKSMALKVTTKRFFSKADLRKAPAKKDFATVTFVTGERRQAKRVDYSNSK